MCGIMGYTGAKNAAEVVLRGLYSLEYRGYDSAGLALFGNEGLYGIKTAGKVEKLEEKLQRAKLLSEYPVTNSAAIGHTRWATHGAPTDENSHPHGTQRVMLVHNGILENHLSLRAELEAAGEVFLSETDTEAAALWVDRLYLACKDPKRALRGAVEKLRGSFAFAVIFADFPQRIYAIRRGSPLIIGRGEGENFLASDMTALLPYTRRYIPLEEDVLAEITSEGVSLETLSGDGVFLEEKVANWAPTQAQKGGYAHFMRKEISEEPDAILQTLSPRIQEGLPAFSSEGIQAETFSSEGNVRVVACGTALHAGMLGARRLRALAKIPASWEIASEFRYGETLLSEKDTVVLLSQSGETADTLAALRLAKGQGASTVAMVNVVGSSVASEADAVLYTHAGPEIAVASTKAYTVQSALFSLLAVFLGWKRGVLSEEEARKYTAALSVELPRAIQEILEREEEIAQAVRSFRLGEHAFFLGRNVDYDCAVEASLKLKEISYIHSEAYAAGELKHGTISLVEEGTPILVCSTSSAHREKLLSNVKEVLARGGRVFAVVSAEDQELSAVAHGVFRLPPMSEFASPIAAQTVFQLFAYHAACQRGCSVDQPRNLAKSVTVE